MIKLKSIIDSHKRDINRINNQRILWLRLSSVIFMSVVIIIFSWDTIQQIHNSFWWVIISIMLIVTVNWWYWTMKTISTLLKHQQEENIIIKELINELRDLKKIINQIDNN